MITQKKNRKIYDPVLRGSFFIMLSNVPRENMGTGKSCMTAEKYHLQLNTWIW